VSDIKKGDWVRFDYKGKIWYGLADDTVYVGRMMVRVKPNGLKHPTLIPLSDCTVVDAVLDAATGKERT
jgi:hypothetical protein